MALGLLGYRQPQRVVKSSICFGGFVEKGQFSARCSDVIILQTCPTKDAAPEPRCNQCCIFIQLIIIFSH